MKPRKKRSSTEKRDFFKRNASGVPYHAQPENVKPEHSSVCKEKRRHPDEMTARAAATVVIKEHSLHALWVYECTACRGWHLSSNNGGLKRRVTQESLYHKIEVPPDGTLAVYK